MSCPATPGNPADPVVILMLMHLATAVITYPARSTLVEVVEQKLNARGGVAAASIGPVWSVRPEQLPSEDAG